MNPNGQEQTCDIEVAAEESTNAAAVAVQFAGVITLVLFVTTVVVFAAVGPPQEIQAVRVCVATNGAGQVVH